MLVYDQLTPQRYAGTRNNSARFHTIARKKILMNTTGYDSRLLHGLVLAGGDGKRLEPYIEELKGERLSKQFVNFVGREKATRTGRPAS